MRFGFQVMTFNIRTEKALDGGNSFSRRKKGICAFFAKERPELICFQELTPSMEDALAPALPGYYFAGCGREADLSGEQCSIAYRSDAFRLMRADTFWLSNTPEQAGSRYSNQSRHPRICTVLWLAVRSGKAKQKLIRVYNTHLDHESEYARVTGLREILRHMTAEGNRPALPTVLTGDFNALPGSAPLEMITRSEQPALTDLTRELPGTFHAYGKSQDKIDYIFTDRKTAAEAKNASIFHGEEESGGIYLSDHYPVGALLYV